jgi:hypothetical protein
LAFKSNPDSQATPEFLGKLEKSRDLAKKTRKTPKNGPKLAQNDAKILVPALENDVSWSGGEAQSTVYFTRKEGVARRVFDEISRIRA